MTDKLDEARMSAAAKLQRAFEREQQKSAASRKRGEEVMQRAKEDAKKAVNEAEEKKKPKAEKPEPPPTPVHQVGVIVSQPDHPMEKHRDKQIQKFLRVATKSQKDAIRRAKQHFEYGGFTVHDTYHHSMVEETDMNEAAVPYWKKPSWNKKMSQLAKQERLAREKKEAEAKQVKEGLKPEHNMRPGWMLKADPELAAKVKKNKEIAKARKASYGNPAAGKSVKEEVELEESMTDSWKSVQSMDKGSVTGGKDQVKKRLAYLNAVHAHHKKFGNDTKKVKSEIESINRSRIAEDIEQVDEAKKANTASARAELGKRPRKELTGSEADKKKKESDDAWERLMAHAASQGKNVKEGYVPDHSGQLNKKDSQTMSKLAALMAKEKAAKAAKQKTVKEAAPTGPTVGNAHSKTDDKFKAYLAAQRKKRAEATTVKEEAEQIDELKKSTLASYVKKASDDRADTGYHSGYWDRARGGSKPEYVSKDEKEDGQEKRKKGIGKALHRLTKEEAEETNEAYQSHSGPSHGNPYGGSGFGRRPREDDEGYSNEYTHSRFKRKKPMYPASNPHNLPNGKKDVREEAEQIEERNKENATKRKMMDASRGARYKAAGNPVPEREEGHKTAQQHNKAIGRALRAEEAEQVDEKLNMKTASMKDVIDDFADSNAPQFQGKSGAKRRQMAIAAKLKGERTMKEQINSFKSYLEEELDEAAWPGTPEYKAKFGDTSRGKVGTQTHGNKGTQTVTATGVKHERNYEKAEKETGETEKQEKRGRGRPKGSASGARQKGSAAKGDNSKADYTGFKLHLPSRN